MTVIACKVTESKIEIASDTQTTWGHHKMPSYAKSHSNVNVDGKLFEVNDAVIGCAGQCSHIGMFQIFCRKQFPMEMTKDRIFEWISEFKVWSNKEGQVKFEDLSIGGIIVKDKKAFWFDCDLEVQEITEHFAYGSGMFLALGALELGATAIKAVEVAIKYDLYCGGKVTSITIDK